ncbi:hypothetical protein DFH09DRAFT_917940, partial [Mycena vulgaris]
RPSQVQWWISRARKQSPVIDDPVKFGEKWWDWWVDINPPWRKTLSPMLRKEDGVWTCMDLAGPNGFLNVLISLKWWADEMDGSVRDSKRWIDGVSEVMWVLEKMTS